MKTKLTNDEIAQNLDNIKIGSYGLNKILVGNKKHIYLTISDTKMLDSELTFEPQELLKFCKKVLKLANKVQKA